MKNFGLRIAMSHQAELICYSHTKSQFHASTHSQDIRLSAILKSDWLRAPIWGGKSIITTILLSDCFMETKMKKNPKKIQNTLFWGPFAPNKR